MNDLINTDLKERQPLTRRVLPLLTILTTLALTLAIFYIARRFPDQLYDFKNYGYLGVFVVCLISNASIILPVPGILIFIPVLGVLNPVLTGLIGAAGGTIGESTAYMAGLSGRAVINQGWMYRQVDSWMKRWGIWAVFFIAAIPLLPVDIAGMIAGALRFPYGKFLLAVLLGKSLKYVLVMVLASWGWNFMPSFIPVLS